MQKYILNNRILISNYLSRLYVKFRSNVFLFDRNLFSTLSICLHCRENKVLKDQQISSLSKLEYSKCDKCGKDVIPILEMNAFQLFGLTYSFSIDRSLVEHKYRELMKCLHPDKNENINRDIPSHVIKNYRTLNDPFERAILLISITKNLSRSNLLNLMDSLPIEPGLLEEIFDTETKIKRVDSGYNGSYIKLSNLIKENELKIINCISLLEKEFQEKDIQIGKIVKILKELRVYQRINEKILEILT